MNADAQGVEGDSRPATSSARVQGKVERDRNRRELLELLFAHLVDAIFLLEPDGRIVDVNPAACTMLGFAREELLLMHPWDFVTSVSREEILELIRGFVGLELD
jgi:PAS domain-containing protein